jgi:hypothetical protein
LSLALIFLCPVALFFILFAPTLLIFHIEPGLSLPSPHNKNRSSWRRRENGRSEGIDFIYFSFSFSASFLLFRSLLFF